MERRHHKAGFALMQVMVVVALVTVMSLVMLSESSLKAQVRHNTLLASQAECLAESGVNLATYYLLNPWASPSAQSSYWTGGSNISLGTGVSGVISQVTVTPANRPDLSKPQEYLISSTGTASSASGASLSRTVKARVAINEGVRINKAGVMSAGSLTLNGNTMVTGDVTVDGTLKNLGFILGKASFRVLDPLSTGTILNGVLGISAGAVVPAPANPVLYPTYAYTDGYVYGRSEITTATLGGGMGAVLGATAANPAGIHRRAGSLTLGDNVRIDGTLIVEGDLILSGTNVIINAQATNKGGFPGLIVTGDIRTDNLKTMTVNGSVWVGKTIRPNGFGSAGTTLTVNGALLFGGSSTNVAVNAGNIRPKWDANRTVLPDMDQKHKRRVAVVYWHKP